MIIYNTAQNCLSSNLIVNTLPRKGVYMGNTVDGVPGAFPPGWKDYSIVPVEQAKLLGAWLQSKGYTEAWIDIEYNPANPTTTKWHMPDPVYTQTAIDLWKPYLTAVRAGGYAGLMSIYCEPPSYQEYARMIAIEDYAREQQMFDLDDNYIRKIRQLSDYVDSWNPCLYMEWMFSDPAISDSEKKQRFTIALETSAYAYSYYFRDQPMRPWICGYDGATPLPEWVMPFQLSEINRMGLDAVVWTGASHVFTQYQKGVITMAAQ